MPKIYKSNHAKIDLVEWFVYLTENANIDTAERFLKNAEVNFSELATNPLIGSPLPLKNPKLTGMRKWRVREFNNILIFYIPSQDGISIIRVIHATQDWWNLFEIS
ncbi:MAG: type II toxin-antitoxin system RelE/ParE family toxin [Pseudomonadota bacterium]